MMHRILLLASILAFAACGRKDARDTAPPPAAARGAVAAAFLGCPPEGAPGGDAEFNLLKNRDTEPAQVTDMTVDEMLVLHPPGLLEAGSRHRRHWPRAALDTLQRYEVRGVRLEGFLLGAKESGPESCNCRREDLRDWHVWIGARRPASRDEAKLARHASVVTEPTPRWQRRNGWRLRQFKALARQGARVRITGWLLWDHEHPEELPAHKGEAATRGTLWEVHPVTRIELFSAGRWVEWRDVEDE
jgi:hypothetical protein